MLPHFSRYEKYGSLFYLYNFLTSCGLLNEKANKHWALPNNISKKDILLVFGFSGKNPKI